MSDPDASEALESGGRSSSASPAVGCLITLLITIAGASLLLIVLSLALRGEARFSKGDLGELRVWLVREPTNQGLAISTTRIMSGSERSGEICVRTTARFLMLRSEQEIPDVAYCACFERQGETWVEVGDCPTSNP